MNENIYIYDETSQLRDEDIQQIYHILHTLQEVGQIKKYMGSFNDCRTKYGNLDKQKRIFVLKLNNLIVSFASLSVANNPTISFIGTRLEYQRKGFAKKIISELKDRFTSLMAGVDSLFTEGIEGLLQSCNFKKSKVGTIWKWERNYDSR